MKPENIGRLVKVDRTDKTSYAKIKVSDGADFDVLVLSVSPGPGPPEGWGFTSIDLGDLTKKVEEVISNPSPEDVGKYYIEAIADRENSLDKHAKIFEEIIDDPIFSQKLDDKGIDKAKLKQKFKDKQKEK